MAVVTSTSGPAFADVDRVSGSATPLNIGGTVPSPTVSGEAIEPTDGYGPTGSGLLQSGVQCPSQGLGGVAPVPLVISVGLLEACTQGAGVATNDEAAGHLGFSESSASVANVVLGTTDLGVVSSECRADGNGARGSSTIVGGSGLPTNPLPNTLPQLPAGLLSLVLNEQIVNNTPGTATITVNAVHANILGIDIIIGQSVCNAFGPDVNVSTTVAPTTTGPTTPPTTGGTTTTTACPATGCPTTTLGPITTTTVCPPASCPTTTTTKCPTPTCPTPTTLCPPATCPTPTPQCPASPCPTPTTTCPTPATCTQPPPCPTHTTCPTTKVGGALVRTGSDNDLKVAWAAMALTLGALFLMGTKSVPGQTAPATGPTPQPSGDGRRRSRRETAKDIFREMRRFK
jgi:hypothetical protein